MLSFEIVKFFNSEAIQIHLDEDGLRILTKKIAAARRFGHVHLHGHEYGMRWEPSGEQVKVLTAHDLDPKTPFGTDAVKEVIIDWDGEPDKQAAPPT